MSDVVRNTLASALVDNLTSLKGLEPYVHHGEREEDTLGQFCMEKLKWLNNGDQICGETGQVLRPKNPSRSSTETVARQPKRKENFCQCGAHDQRTITKEWKTRLNTIIQEILSSTETVARQPKRKENFCQCGAHDQRTITKEWKTRLNTIIQEILSKLAGPGFYVPQHMLRNESLCSSNLDTILANRTVWMNFPHAITPVCTLASMSFSGN